MALQELGVSKVPDNILIAIKSYPFSLTNSEVVKFENAMDSLVTA